MSDLFTYNTGEGVVNPNDFRISPSQLSRYFDDTANWWREMLLNEGGFEGSTATELGNCVHAYAEMYTKDLLDTKVIDNYISSISNPEIDKAVLYEQYPIMTAVLRDQWLSKLSQASAQCERFVTTEVLPGVVIGGSIDRYDPLAAGGTIYDYKTMGSLDKARLPKSFARPYFFQQLAYAWALRKLGEPVNQVKLVFVTRNNTGRFNDKGKPLKDYPSTVHELTEAVTPDNMAFIESVLTNVAEAVLLWKSNPEYRHILAQDQRLKLPPPPRLFTNK